MDDNIRVCTLFQAKNPRTFQGPYFEISRTLLESNERALGKKTSVFRHFVSISRMLYFVYLNICFHSFSFTLKPLSINISGSSSIKNQGLSRTKVNFK